MLISFLDWKLLHSIFLHYQYSFELLFTFELILLELFTDFPRFSKECYNWITNTVSLLPLSYWLIHSGWRIRHFWLTRPEIMRSRHFHWKVVVTLIFQMEHPVYEIISVIYNIHITQQLISIFSHTLQLLFSKHELISIPYSGNHNFKNRWYIWVKKYHGIRIWFEFRWYLEASYTSAWSPLLQHRMIRKYSFFVCLKKWFS